MRIKKFVLVIFFVFLGLTFGNTQEKIALEFKNQKISDILLSISTVAGKSILIDDTVGGNATFTFNDESFEKALDRFLNYCDLYYEKIDDVYLVSKMRIVFDEKTMLISCDADEISPVLFVKFLCKKTKTSIMCDSFPNQSLSVHLRNVSLLSVLELVASRYDGFEVSFENNGYFIRDTGNRTLKKSDNRISLSMKGDLFSVNAQKVLFSVFVSSLFKKAGKEYVLLSKNSSSVENIVYSNKEFDTLLSLVLQQVNCDFSVKDGIYYIFDIQQKDSAKIFKQTVSYSLKFLNVNDVIQLFPQELNVNSFIKTDKNTNSFFITGSDKEINPIIDFLSKIDVPLKDKFYAVYSFNNIEISKAVGLIPKNLLFSDAILIPGASAFVCLTNDENDKILKDFIKSIDICDTTRAVKLKYIKSENLVKHLPPTIEKSRVNVTGDQNLVFFTGNDEQYAKFIDALNVLDKSEEQIRYQFLVIQYQKTEGSNIGANLSFSKTDDPAYSSVTANLSNLLNINFDVVTKFGLQAAGTLNAEISENRAKVLADTTLNGISGQEINFENKNIFRYRDIITDTSNTATYSSVVREIASGLSIKINGWVSGDGMITVGVTADLSKQGSSSSYDVPSTSQKSVKTNVRTKSGQPIVISGLLQQEIDKTQSRVPILGKIPLLGNLFRVSKDSTSTTELVIYLVPYVEKTVMTKETEEKNIRSLYTQYLEDK